MLLLCVRMRTRVHSSVVRAADRRSAGPWFKSGCALCFASLLSQSDIGPQIAGNAEPHQGASDCCVRLQLGALPTELWPVLPRMSSFDVSPACRGPLGQQVVQQHRKFTNEVNQCNTNEAPKQSEDKNRRQLAGRHRPGCSQHTVLPPGARRHVSAYRIETHIPA